MGALDLPPLSEVTSGGRLALVIATGMYQDIGLSQLRSPATDAAELVQVLADPEIGGFTVTTMLDQPAQEIRLAVEDFLVDRSSEDLILLHLSCHGMLDNYRRLYFAATDTRKNRLAATGVESTWIVNQLERCRARSQVVILDSCFSGAFTRGVKGDIDIGLKERFGGHARGRVILTASTAFEYSFERHSVEGRPTDAAVPAGSVFTSLLVEGMRTGAADADQDGYISVDDAYQYIYHRVRDSGVAQTPQRWLYAAEGSSILLARSPAGPGTPTASPVEAGSPTTRLTNLPAPTPDGGGARGEFLSLDIPDSSGLVGRTAEIENLTARCTDTAFRIIAVAGLRGVGKTQLCAKIAAMMAGQTISDGTAHFDQVQWHQMINPPPARDFIGNVLLQLGSPTYGKNHLSDEMLTQQLLNRLNEQRCLIVVDNVETVLMEMADGLTSPEASSYQRLFERLGTGHHRSTVLVTSRELPAWLRRLANRRGPVYVHTLQGVSPLEAHLIFEQIGDFQASEQAWADMNKGISPEVWTPGH